jgi:signal transduction histidine kinase/type II secretory pathway pseudopilin PulG
MKWSLERKIIAGGFGLAMLILGIVSVISYQNTTQLFERQKQVEKTYEVLQDIRTVLTTLRDAERARRGYIITGKALYLETYNTAIQDINAKFDAARRATIDNPNQQRRLDRIKPIISQRVAIIKKSIDLYNQNKFDTEIQIKMTDDGLMLHDKIGEVIAQMEAEEKSLLRRRTAESEASFQDTVLMQMTGFSLSFGLLFAVYLLLQRQIKKRHLAEAIRRELEKENQISELKIRFLSMVSHEFRTPLSTILVSAQLLENCKQDWPQEKKLKNLHRIQSAAKIMTQLLTDMLTLSRAEAGKLEFKPQWMDLEEFCNNLVEEIELTYRAQQSIFFISEDPGRKVWLDEKLLRSIFNNLLSNAIKYSSEDSHIYLTLGWESEAVVFQIQDQGIGVSPEDQQHLFESFYRGTNVGDIPGTGLGLAVVKKCVDLHSGSIAVESKVGIGTTFTVTLPLNNSPILTNVMN